MRHYNGQALLDIAKPGSGATVTVNIAGTLTRATIYSDDGVTVKANPFSTDGAGRYDFYASSGKYDLIISGAGIVSTTVANEVLFDPFEINSADTALSLKGTLTSSSPNPAATGSIRLGSADVINFRNSANSADINALSKNTNDVVILGGAAGVQSNSALTVPTGSALSADQILPFNTLGQGGFFAVSILAAAGSLSTQFCSSANEVRVFQFFLPFYVQVGRVDFGITLGQAATTGDLGIYDINGNRLAYTGGFSTASSVGISAALVSPVTLPAGFYYLAQTNSSSTPQISAVGGTTLNQIANAGGSRLFGVASNVATNGVLPQTLGNISAGTSISPAACYFER